MRLQIFWTITLPLVLIIIIGVVVFVQIKNLEYELGNIDCGYLDTSGDTCAQHGKPCGVCSETVYWIEYNSERNSCEFKQGQGCSASTPFKSMEKCIQKCMN